MPLEVRDGDHVVRISHSRLRAIKLLLERGADVGSVGQVLLSYAAENNYEVIAELLLATGRVDAHRKDRDGLTPLERAVRRNHEGIVKLLSS